MNQYEHKMRDLLKRGKDKYGVLATKAEFEAEGTRTDELLRLLEIAHRADVDIALKIGGCEAIRDLLEARQFGVKYIIAPMIETAYALSKYIAAIEKVFDKVEREDLKFLFNIETITAYNNLEEMLEVASANENCHGIVFGRVDFAGSLGLGRTGIESEQVTNCGIRASKLCLGKDMDFVVGGAVSIDALGSLQQINKTHLTRFETRKIVFQGSSLMIPEIESGLKDAVHFELLWLLNKRDYYGFIYKEDEARIKMLEDRWKVLNNA